jgi:SAM-dependent methyltransferase
MLVHVEALEKALQACARVLKPGGLMLILTSFATDLLFAGEVEEFFEPLAIVPRNLEPGTFDAALNEAGLRIEYSDNMGGEGLEHTEEQSQRYSKELLRLSRMSRRPEQLIEVLGQRQFDIARSLYYWSIFLLIGKLTNTIYLVRK